MESLSASNPRVRQLRRLLRERKARDQAGLFVIEGPGLLAEALQCGVFPSEVFITADHAADQADLAELTDHRVPIWILDDSVLEAAASTRSPQPLLAVMPHSDATIAEAIDAETTFVVIGAGVREPGNAGTLVRTAAAAGAEAVLFCDDPVDVFNPKVVRASAGAIFRVPVVRNCSLDELHQGLSAANLRVVGLSGEAHTAYDTIDYTEPVALVVGNEAAGFSSGARQLLDVDVSIPMAAGVESLNVSAAAAAVCFEVSRQRR